MGVAPSHKCCCLDSRKPSLAPRGSGLRLSDQANNPKATNLGKMVAESGYDVTIICTSDHAQAMYWEERLNNARGAVIPSTGIAVAVDEDWDGGAGNFLGTLYAWKKACAKQLAAESRLDLAKELEEGASMAIFHTAGKGTRMAPLPGGENNNKPGVKLPAPGGPSILECVIRQTGSYAPSRRGRLSVFWGDQIFVPSVPVGYAPQHHADIACMLGPMPSAEEWAERGLEKYGCIAADADMTIEAMLEKVPHSIAEERVEACEGVEQVGASLGSFSLSCPFLLALMDGFQSELAAKAGKLDSDPHLWMPMTLTCEAYAEVMVRKGEFTADEAERHWSRVSDLVSAFRAKMPSDCKMLGAVDVGLDCAWWDYGLLKLYVKNMLLLTDSGAEGTLARAFFGIPMSGPRTTSDCKLGAEVAVDAESVVSTCRIARGTISGSALFGVTAKEASLDNAIAVNCCAKKLILATGAVCYNVYDESDEGVVLGENEVRVGVWMPGNAVPYFEMKSNWAEIDGGKKFKEPVMDNSKSFQDVYNMNLGVDVIKCSEVAASTRRAFADTLFPQAPINDVKLSNMALMTAESGYDVAIVCTSDEAQAKYWEERLNGARGSVIPTTGVAVAVDEDWEGGAGNFLGTLYAWKKACAKLLSADSPRDLKRELEEGASMAIFHTAGKGTRMAPMPGAENNNKPGVKLPAPGGPSILECVIRQTGAYATARQGRLSVFWGDQIFVPSVPAEYVPKHHADIACMLGPMPSAAAWAERGLEKYGCIAAGRDNNVEAMLEKVSHEIASERVKACSGVEKIGASLGSFSLSSPFLAALMAGFQAELESKAGKLDSDPHLWMPLTLTPDAYADVMVKKGEFTMDEAKSHWQRVCALVEDFKAKTTTKLGMFGAVDVGLDCSWWDYGLLKLYVKNMLLLTEHSTEATLARAFFGIPESGTRVAPDTVLGEAVIVDSNSVVCKSKIVRGSIGSSSLFGVAAEEVSLDSAIAVNCSAKKLTLAKGAVCYNVHDESEEGVVLNENEVRVGVWMPEKEVPYFEMKSNWSEIDGGKNFKEPVKGNTRSFQDVYNMNQGVDVIKCSDASATTRAHFAASLPPHSTHDGGGEDDAHGGQLGFAW